MCKMQVTDIVAAFYICETITLANVVKIKCSRIKDGLPYMDFNKTWQEESTQGPISS